jgi:cellulose synthase/poly-beta-1,6-N-acetylglucosamine synthase-like glycosyltransferase
MRAVLLAADVFALLYLLFLNYFYASLLLRSMVRLRQESRLAEDVDFQRLISSDSLPPVTIVVPAHNESRTIEASVGGLLRLNYQRYEVIVVNDGSADDTLERLRDAFDLYEIPRIHPHTIPTALVRGVYRSRRYSHLAVVDKENGGKADALNAGINASRFPWVMAVDADTLLEPDVLLRMTRPFILGRETIVAVGGTVCVANDCLVEEGRMVRARLPRRALAAMQVVEYLRSFVYGRIGWSAFRSNILISGALGLFSREHLLAIGGYDATSTAEDLELVVRLHRHLRERQEPYEMPFISDPIAWTEVPESVAGLSRQRARWHGGLLATMWAHRGMILSPRYGRVGLVAMPFHAFGEALAPLIEAFGCVVTALGLWAGVIDGTFLLLFLCCSLGFGMILSLVAIVLEERHHKLYVAPWDLGRLVLCAALETLWFRPMTVWWRLRAFLNVGRRGYLWGESVRRGFTST